MQHLIENLSKIMSVESLEISLHFLIGSLRSHNLKRNRTVSAATSPVFSRLTPFNHKDKFGLHSGLLQYHSYARLICFFNSLHMYEPLASNAGL